MPNQNNQGRIDIAAEMIGCVDPSARWHAMDKILKNYGATSTVAGAVDKQSAMPHWVRSSLSVDVASEYAAAGHAKADIMAAHAARSAEPLLWRTAQRVEGEDDPERCAFASFVRDSGHGFILSMTRRPLRETHVLLISYCTDQEFRADRDADHLETVQGVIQVLLPWLDWPEDTCGPDFIRLDLGRPVLSPREIQVLRLLAGGLKNARIADALGVSEATVAKHLIAARRKLGARTREEAIASAIRARILPG